MELLAHAVLGALALACMVPLLVLATEALAAVCSRRASRMPANVSSWRLAVLVPAHNEEHVLARTLVDIVACLEPRDRCVVVADNCSDGTAQSARTFPVEVLERHSESQRGKGFALDFGIEHLRSDPPDAVLIVDADCHVEPGSLHALMNVALKSGRPVQGGNVLYPPAHSGVGARLSAFAFHFKNHVRSLGMAQLGGPSLLFGTGMAFPWKVVDGAAWATSDAVEDMQLAVKLALDGNGARYAPIPCVSGVLPVDKTESKLQRQRWEHGHVRTLLKYAPLLVWAGIKRRRLELALMGVDLAVPPLSLLAVLVMLTAMIEVIGAWFTGIWLWAILLAATAAGTLLAILLAWWRFGRHILSLEDLVLIPVYIAGKLPIYFGLLRRPQKTWDPQAAVPSAAPVKEREL